MLLVDILLLCGLSEHGGKLAWLLFSAPFPLGPLQATTRARPVQSLPSNPKVVWDWEQAFRGWCTPKRHLGKPVLTEGVLWDHSSGHLDGLAWVKWHVPSAGRAQKQPFSDLKKTFMKISSFFLPLFLLEGGASLAYSPLVRWAFSFVTSTTS